MWAVAVVMRGRDGERRRDHSAILGERRSEGGARRRNEGRRDTSDQRDRRTRERGKKPERESETRENAAEES